MEQGLSFPVGVQKGGAGVCLVAGFKTAERHPAPLKLQLGVPALKIKLDEKLVRKDSVVLDGHRKKNTNI